MGFDLLEYVKKSNYGNTAFIAPAGYGKTQILLKCFEALKSENGVVPCYIDIAKLNTKDLYTELQKYFFKDEKSYLGSIGFFKRFYNMVSAQSEIKYIEFLRGNIGFHEYRCGMHYTLVNVDKHCKYDCYYYMKLYDIFKSNKQNETEKPIIPIYDLNLYKSNITDVLGISAGVEDILEKQAQIYTKYLTFND